MTQAITSPAAAAAAARCLLARRSVANALGTGLLRKAIDSGHPRTCLWCDYPLPVLAGYLNEFKAIAFDSTGRAKDPEVQEFESLPRREQQRLRWIAQYGEDPEAVAVPA